jgi:hypothetical protein
MKTIRLVTIIGLMLALSSAQANTFTFYLDTVITGDTPSGTAPWLTATFVDWLTDGSLAVGQVQLTMSASGLTGGEDVTTWLFNLDPTLTPSLLSFVRVSGTGPSAANTNVLTSVDGQNTGACCGAYDIEFDFPPPPGTQAARFNAGESLVYSMTYSGGGTFNATSFNVTDPDKGYFTAAHVQDTTGPAGSTKITGDTFPPEEVVPEPSFYLTIAPGMLGLMYMAYRRRRAA